MPRNPELKCKINVTNALKDVRQHKENISCFGEKAKQEMMPLLKTLDKYKPVFDRHGLTDLVRFLKKDCRANDYVGVLRWLESLERDLQRISMSHGHKSKQSNDHKSEQGHNGENEHGKAKCQQCTEMWCREGYRLLMELMAEAALEALAEAVINAMNDPWLDLRILLNPDYWYWLMMAVAILEENGINIIEN